MSATTTDPRSFRKIKPSFDTDRLGGCWFLEPKEQLELERQIDRLNNVFSVALRTSGPCCDGVRVRANHVKALDALAASHGLKHGESVWVSTHGHVYGTTLGDDGLRPYTISNYVYTVAVYFTVDEPWHRLPTTGDGLPGTFVCYPTADDTDIEVSGPEGRTFKLQRRLLTLVLVKGVQ